MIFIQTFELLIIYLVGFWLRVNQKLTKIILKINTFRADIICNDLRIRISQTINRSII